MMRSVRIYLNRIVNEQSINLPQVEGTFENEILELMSKNHLFLWLRNRTTDNRKCEKARNIKERHTIEMLSLIHI